MARLADAERELATYKAKEAEKAEADRLAAEEKLKEKGKYEELLKQRSDQLAAESQRVAETERRSKTYALERDLSIALSKSSIVEGAAPQLMKLLKDDFEVVADGESWKVQTRDGKTPEQFVTERLASKEYAHFVRSDTKGGGGAGNGNKATVTPMGDQSAKHLTASDVLIATIREQKAANAAADPLGGYQIGSRRFGNLSFEPKN